jgi:hypothetical protein
VCGQTGGRREELKYLEKKKEKKNEKKKRPFMQ